MMIAGISIYIWLIAYGGATLHALGKLMMVPDHQNLSTAFKRRDIIVYISSLIAIPIILVIMTDDGVKELLPLNYITAFLTGYQTQSVLRLLTNVLGKKYLNETDNSGPTP